MIVLLLNQKCGVGRTARVAFCRCAAMPKPTPHCDRRRPQGSAWDRSEQRANARLPSRFADPDTWTLYARNNAANEQLEDPLIRRTAQRPASRRLGAAASRAPCSAWDRYRRRAA
jgi:hypothetical protein